VREADHSPPSSVEVKKCVELYLHSPNTSSCFMAWCFVKHRDHFLLLLSLAPQPSSGLGLLHKIRLNFLEASQQFYFYRVLLLAPRPTRRTRPLYLYPPEAGWLPILVASYDTHGLRWDYSYSSVTTRGQGQLYLTIISLRITSFSPSYSVCLVNEEYGE
jgi:hypothetical protein